MIIAVASGKGGTGKTMIAISLALVGVDMGHSVALVDCDVEAPNAHLFIRPIVDSVEEVALPVPRVDLELCTYCRRCAEACKYHAIAVAGQAVLVFDELCHGCGACTLACPENAIRETPHVIGQLSRGYDGDLQFAQGELQIGEPLAVPIIHRLLRQMPEAETTILDAPPGNSCSLVATLRKADYALLVTEPTPFGLHDVRIAAEVARNLQVPAGLIINRDGGGYPPMEEFAQSARLPILLRIPFERKIAEVYAAGSPLVRALPEYQALFRALFSRIRQEACR